MSNTEHIAAHAVTPGDHEDRDDRSHLTVEDTGSTTDASDLARDDARDASDDLGTGTRTGGAATTEGTERHGLADIDDDGSIGHVFDQTNGVIEGADGDSDGTAESDVYSGAERNEGGTLDNAESLGRDAVGGVRRDPED